jgi:asparagine synthase (glutamine-hydrolysing)
MTECLRHRGPDGEGSWVSPDRRVALGHRRLAVIDLSTGDQPMSDASGRYTVILNGEIYNYLELRRELEASGSVFRTRSDTEVLLQLLARDWHGALQHLVGMFAFAAWDTHTGELLLARDRIGEKPLFYAVDTTDFVFASSFAAIERTRSKTARPDVAAVADYLMLGYIPAPRSIDADIFKVPAGHFVRVNADGVSVERYWQIGEQVTCEWYDYGTAVERLRELLIEAVRIRLRSDVPLGVFLSGGIDSSLITAIAAKASASPVRSFSVGFDVERFDESSFASAIARHVGTDHTTLPARYDVIDLLPDMVRHYGEPFGDSSALAVWAMAREARRHVTVVLGGDGGDEAFAGYPWYRTATRLRALNTWLSAPASIAARQLGRNGVPGVAALARAQRGARIVALEDADAFAALRVFYDPLEARRLFDGPLLDRFEQTFASGSTELAALFEEASGSPLRRMRLVDLQGYLPECLLPKVDVATMAHGLELRSPLLDPGIIDIALSLPDDWLIDRRGGGKRILKDVLRTFLPTDLFERPKQGFTMPLQDWFAGPLQARIEQLSRSDALEGTGLIRMDGLRTMIVDQQRGARDHGQRLYHLLMLDEWLRSR